MSQTYYSLTQIAQCLGRDLATIRAWMAAPELAELLAPLLWPETPRRRLWHREQLRLWTEVVSGDRTADTATRLWRAYRAEHAVRTWGRDVPAPDTPWRATG